MYQVLYRKYRPKTFHEVVGQDHVTVTLANELKNGKLSHAYLFTGSRGTGKTTCSRILAKAVNCLHPVDGNPCNECENCVAIDNNSLMDVIEIDAASNNGVDNIRDLREEANFTPSKGKYRVYIIDEVHMLSIGAFNALLKTLEEPPEYVLFILATTEVHKLPATILSRCQKFDFKRIDPESIAKHLAYVADCEGFSIEEEAAMLVARIADGALRDALSLLDQCASRSKHIDSKLVSNVAGITERTYLFDLADFINTKNTASALKMIDALHNSSCDMERLCTELINHFRNLMIAKTVKKFEELIICTQDEHRRISAQSETFTLETILYCLNVLENTTGNLKRGMNKRVETEMAMVRLCSPKLEESNKALLSRISKLEAMLQSGNVISKPSESIQSADNNAHAPVVEPKATDIKPQAKPQQAEIDRAETPDSEKMVPFVSWSEVLMKLNDYNKPLVGMLTGSVAFQRGEMIVISSNNPALDALIRQMSHRDSLSNAIFEVTGKKFRLSMMKNGAQQQTAVAKDPLDNLIKRASQTDVQLNIE